MPVTRRLRLHHIGIVVANIDTYLATSFWERRGEIINDLGQGARLCMAGLPGEDAAAELIEPLDERSRVWGALQRGAGPHHLCFTVPSMSAGDELLQCYRLLPVTSWEPAPLFDGRAVRFAYNRSRELMEFVSDDVLA